MAEIVFILGAGASQQAGAPLMANFLDVAEDLWRTERVKSYSDSFKAVFSAIGRMQAIHSKAQLDLNNIESVFNALEMARILDKFPGDDKLSVGTAIEALKTLIASTLEQTISFPADSRVHPPKPYQAFADVIHHLRSEANPKRSVAVLTFNYDLAADYALFFNGLGPEYCLDATISDRVPLLKLHGSLNWALCSKCRTISPWKLQEYFKVFQYDLWGEAKQVRLNLWSNFGRLSHCDLAVAPLPFLVPPTWNKTDQQEAIRGVWQRAAKELTTSESIFVIGYSLPETDGFFRTLYALGVVGDIPLKRMWVFDTDNTGNVENRFRGLMGPGAESRFRYFRKSFAEAMSIIQSEFPKRA